MSMMQHGASASPSPSGGQSAAAPGSLAASLALLANHDSMHKIRDLLPGDTSARTELLLSLLKTSYTSSLHSADVRMASLTQEVVSLRAQQTYSESKLRAAEALAEEAGRAVQEERKRVDMLMQENVRLKADNQALKAENQQLINFKSILMSAANGVAGQQQQLPAGSSPPVASYGGGGSLYAGSGQQYSPPAAHLSSADFEFKQQHVATPQQSATQQSAFFFSPTKSRNSTMHDSISISNMGGGGGSAGQQFQPQSQSQSHAQHTPLPSYPKTSSYVHVMPSPLAADALSTPAPVSHAQAQAQRHNGATAAASAHSSDILSEINAHLSSSGRGRSTAAPSPARGYPSTPSASASFASSAAMLPGSGSGSGGANLVDQARALFQTAQARLPSATFGDFVALVQQFRSISASGAGADAHSWDAIRHRAAQLLGPYQDIYALFEQLLQATQMQQQR